MGFMRPPDLAHVQHLALAVRLALGNAETWINAWYRQGWDTGQTPRVGAVAYYAANVGPPSNPSGAYNLAIAFARQGLVYY